VTASRVIRGWIGLRREIAGDVVLAADHGYLVAKPTELGNFDDIEPAAVAYCASRADVSTCLLFAQDKGLPVAIRSGGHSYGGYSTTEGLVIDLSRLSEVAADAGTVVLGPGADSLKILTALSSRGQQIVEGGCATVAAGGFIQGGGFGYLSPSIGMACDSLVAAEVVLADGTIVTASSEENPGLFWALRGGGGGNFGVVTSFTLVPHSLGPLAVTMLSFGWDRAATALSAFTDWLVDKPRPIGGGAYVIQEDARAGAVPAVNVLLVSTGTAKQLHAEAGRLLAAAGEPVARHDTTMTYQEIETWTFQQAGTRRPSYGLERSRLGRQPLSVSDWEAVLAAFAADPRAAQSRQIDVHIMGGAVNDLDRSVTAYVHRDSRFTLNFRVTIYSPAAAGAESRAIARKWVDDGFALINRMTSAETYQNYIDPALGDWKSAYYAENYPRLQEVKSFYDPYRLFNFAQGVDSAA
jgi:FAD/FMN-containing dehydrogenase